MYQKNYWCTRGPVDGLAVPGVFQIESIVGFWFVNAAAAPTTPSELVDRAFLLLEPALACEKSYSGLESY